MSESVKNFLEAFIMQRMSKRKKNERNTSIYFNTNYRPEMKLVSIIMDYCLLHFDVLKFSLEVRLYGEGLYLTLNFSM